MPSIFVASGDGVRVIRDDGTTVQLEGRECTSLCQQGLHLWAIAEGSGVWRGTADGPWEAVAQVASHRLRCLHAQGDDLLLGTAEAHLLRLDDGTAHPIASFDAVEGRDSWYTPWGGPPDTRSISASHGTVYVNVHVGGIVRSTDQGESWRPTIDIDADVHQVLAHPERAGLVLAATALGLAQSEDGGKSWSFHTEGLHAAYSRAVAVSGDTLFLSVSTGPRGGRAAVYRRPLDDDGPFERCEGRLPEWFDGNVDSHCLAATDGAVAFGVEDGAVYISTDGGSAWDQVASGIPSIRAVVVR